VLAGGRSAAISHRSACVLHRLVPRPEDGPKIEVRVPPDRRPRTRGVRFHRMRPLEPDEITTVESVRVTTPARSLIDLAGVSPRAEVERALARAIRKKMLDGRDLLAQLSREPRRAGVGILRAMLGAGGPNPSFTRSEAEARLLAVIRRARLGVPEVNVAVLGYEVDFLWRAEKLVVEVDGRAFHSSEGAFERDRRRDRHFAAHGHQVLRVTWRQITREPERLVGELGMALGFARSALR